MVNKQTITAFVLGGVFCAMVFLGVVFFKQISKVNQMWNFLIEVQKNNQAANPQTSAGGTIAPVK